MFTRIYTGIFASVLLASLLSFGLYKLSYQLRYADYQRLALAGMLDLVEHSVRQLPEARRERYLVLAADLMGAELLLANQQSSNSMMASVTEWPVEIQDKQTVVFRFAEPSEQQFRAHALLILSELKRDRNAPAITELQQYSAFPLSIVPTNSLLLDRQQRSRLAGNSVVVDYQQEPQNSFSVYAPVTADKTLVISDIPQFNALTLQTAILMILASVGVIVLMSYWLVFRLERRVNAIAEMVSLFGKGELASRIALDGKDHIAMLATQINDMAQRIETLLTSQSQLMQAVSHELRTPLSRMRFRIEMMRDDLTGTTVDAPTGNKLDAMGRDIDELEKLVNEVLEHHKLNQLPDLPKAAFNLQASMHRLVEDIALIFPSVEIRYQQDDAGHELYGHQASIERAIQNLLSNACKHANQLVSINSSMRAGKWILVVADDGAGIPAAEHKRIFDAFYRVDTSRNRHTGGHGLGLAIVHRITDLHKGQISVGDSELGGAKFTLVLPAKQVGSGA